MGSFATTSSFFPVNFLVAYFLSFCFNAVVFVVVVLFQSAFTTNWKISLLIYSELVSSCHHCSKCSCFHSCTSYVYDPRVGQIQSLKERVAYTCNNCVHVFFSFSPFNLWFNCLLFLLLWFGTIIWIHTHTYTDWLHLFVPWMTMTKNWVH